MDLAASETLRFLPALAAPASVVQARDDDDRLAAAADWLLRVANDMLAPDRQSVEHCLSLALARLQRTGDEHRQASDTPDEGGQKAEPSKAGLAAWQARRVVAYIDDHLASSIRNRDLAAAAKLSCGYFCQAFKDSFGCPPHAYIVRRRVERAKELLESTTTPLSQIALDCGFSDQSHFSRIFRRVAGEAPRLWRHKHLIDGGAEEA
ncbi:helix-turn-helix transcriptional regulator [Azospirillum sp. B506]|uniref:helix-turn-helix transcriptional regulator n=1 Tax=Azospirillum sp. B506 TaxID=137721 RepID=UPI00034B3C66|nr:AraC family transcriptional regulator [Azospirillum sp. B506]